MKFRARLSREGVVQLNAIVSNLAKQGETSLIYLDTSFFRFAVQSGSIEGVKAFAEINVENMFVEYRIQSNNNNIITFEVDLTLFSKALSSGKFSSACVIKLSKRDDKPHLSFEYAARESLVGLDVLHEIPVKLIRVNNQADILPPNVNDPEVSIMLSKSKSLKYIIDRFTKFSKNVSIRVHPSGRVSMHVDSSNAVIETFFSDISANILIPNFQEEINVTFNIKRLSTVLDYGLLSVQSNVLCK